MNEPLRCVKSSPLPTGLADIFDRLSECISATSFAMRRVRLEDMVSDVIPRRGLAAYFDVRYFAGDSYVRELPS